MERKRYSYQKRKKAETKLGKKSDLRLQSLMVVTVLVVIVVFFKLFDIQILKNQYYSALASDQHQIYEDLVPHRGTVYIEDRFSKTINPLVVNKKMYLIYAVPKQIEDPLEAARDLSSILEVPESELYERLSKEEDAYEPLKKEVPEDRRNEIVEKNIKGIHSQPQEVRYYTENEFASHILGFVGFDGEEKKGRYGIEGFYEDQLSGERGFLAAEKDALGRFVVGGEKLYSEAQDGDSMVLTIDRVMQYKVEKILKEAVEEFGAEKGSIILMNPQNGEMIALANYPSFNPNEYSKVEDVDVFTNSAIYDLYEPGSAFKPIIMASAINLGLVSPHTVFDDSGSLKVDKFTIHNSDFAANGKITMTQVLEKSSNIGMAYVGEMLGEERIHQYLERFGFLDFTGIDLDSEATTDVPPPRKWSTVDYATISFGQGIAITPMRLVNATAALANGGNMVKPHLVKKLIHADGSEEVIDTSFQRQAVSSSTADTVTAMLVSVVENGLGAPAKVPGYKIAGKTGTAQVAAKGKKGYDPDQKITSFIGYGPVEDPQFVMLVKFNNPGGDVWGANTAAPVFKRVAEEFFTYYQIPPTESVSK